jgi:hypothetical protein
MCQSALNASGCRNPEIYISCKPLPLLSERCSISNLKRIEMAIKKKFQICSLVKIHPSTSAFALK